MSNPTSTCRQVKAWEKLQKQREWQMVFTVTWIWVIVNAIYVLIFQLALAASKPTWRPYRGRVGLHLPDRCLSASPHELQHHRGYRVAHPGAACIGMERRPTASPDHLDCSAAFPTNGQALAMISFMIILIAYMSCSPAGRDSSLRAQIGARSQGIFGRGGALAGSPPAAPRGTCISDAPFPGDLGVTPVVSPAPTSSSPPASNLRWTAVLQRRSRSPCPLSCLLVLGRAASSRST